MAALAYGIAQSIYSLHSLLLLLFALFHLPPSLLSDGLSYLTHQLSWQARCYHGQQWSKTWFCDCPRKTHVSGHSDCPTGSKGKTFSEGEGLKECFKEMFCSYRLLLVFHPFCQIPCSGWGEAKCLGAAQVSGAVGTAGLLQHLGFPGSFPSMRWAQGADSADTLWHCPGCLLPAFILQKTAVYVPLLHAVTFLAQTTWLMLRFSSLCRGRPGALSGALAFCQGSQHTPPKSPLCNMIPTRDWC